MEEKLTEYIKTNSYQTKITEELKNSLNREIFGDLMEFIESVAFIRWLIQPENVRGYASDRPRDEEGKIIVDITKPHILKDMDFFRERALFYKKHGRYTHLRPNPNPKSEYAQFWKEEMRRWKHGIVRESDGEWIPGLFYFYLNYSPIWLNEEESKSSTSKKSKGVRKREFPKVWLGDYLFFHYVNQARQSGAHAKLLKCRGVGFSYKTAAMSPCNMYVEPGLPNFHLASDKTFLDGEKGVYGKVLDVLDWIADTTPLPKMRLVNSPRSREVQLGYQDEYGIKKGLKSSVYGISLKDNPDKARGVRGPLIHYEEDGLFPNLEKAWNVNRKAVEDGDIVYGLMFAGGCVCAGTKVWTNSGKLCNIEDVYENQSDGIVGFDGNNIKKEIVEWFKLPSLKPCYRIETTGGDYIECSEDHPIMSTKPGWKTHDNGDDVRLCTFTLAKDLIPGNIILKANEIPIFGDELVNDAYLLGLMIGDGNCTKGCTPQISCGDEEIYDYISKSYDCYISKQFEKKSGGIYRSISIRNIKELLISEGLYGKVKLNKTLPINIHRYNKESLAKLIAGYFDADGCVSFNKKRGTLRLCLTSISKDLLTEVKYQLTKFGIHSNIYKEFRKTGYKNNTYIYRLYISNYNSLKNFYENIPLVCKCKWEKLELINELCNLDRTIFKRGKFVLNQDNNQGQYFVGQNRINNLRTESVSNVEYIGYKPVYNLHTRYTNTYIANQFVTKQTGGTEGADFEGSEKLFRNPLAYNIHGIPNVFDKNSNGETLCGFFWGAYLNRAKCYDEVNGEPDVIGALIQILEDRYVVKYNSSDPQVVTQKLAEEPITPSEAVMRTGGTIFPVADLKDYRDSIKIQGERYFDVHYVGDLTLTNKGVEWKPNSDIKPIRKFPTGTDKPEGAVEIFEMPKTDYKGKIDPNRYIAGIDPYDDDSSQTTSLGSIFIFDLYTDRIVAEYTGRPRFANDFYEICRRLLIFYNAKANYESNKKGIYSYFDQRRCLHLLCYTPQILRDMDYQKESGFGNKALGTNASKPVNAWGRMLQRDWLLSSATIQEYDDNGEQIGEKLNMHTVRSVPYIEELIAWNSDINADRISAMGMLMIYREDRLKYLSNKSSDQDPEEIDKYIEENFKNAYDSQNSYVKWQEDTSWD